MWLLDTCTIIESTRNNAARAVNVALTIRNWNLGERIARVELEGADRTTYGKRVVESLANMLTAKYSKGLDYSYLHKFVKFNQLFPQILETLSPKLLPWSHYNELIRVENEEARNWYAQSLQKQVARMTL